MKKSTGLFISAAFWMAASTGFSQTVAPPYEAALWQGFRTAAVSFTFDDNTPNQFTKAVPLFNEFGYHMTLFTATGTGPAPDWFHADWAGLTSAFAQGHEIASHAVSHQSLPQMADSVQIAELKNSRDTIETRIPGCRCLTLAYPYCNSGKTALVRQYYIAARNCSGSVEASTPANFLSIGSVICGESGLKATKHFNTRYTKAADTKGWVVFLIHGIDNDGGWSSLSSDTLRKTLEYLKTNEDRFWVASFGEIARYILERNAVSVAETPTSDTSLTVQVTDTLDNAVFDIPVTLRRPLPEGWSSAAVTQNGRGVDSKIVEENGTVYVQFDAVPDGGETIITKTGSTGIASRVDLMVSMPILWQNYPNPFNPTTTFRFELGKMERIRLKLFDANGREVGILLDQELPAGPHSTTFNAHELPSGVYFIGLQTADLILFRKILLLK
jgi:peptidoglycan/xylan/chitin deacetylase (PgdA/CDA1 family)